MSLFVTAPTASQIRIDQPVVRVLNASGDADLAQVAADRLRWEGFAAFVDDEPVNSRKFTTIVDYSGQRKGGTRGLLQSILHVSNESVEVSPDANRQYDYEVVIGWSYYPCTYNVILPG
jgi:hypothetical protein